MSIRITVAGDEVRVGDLVRLERRTWRERLLSWPWRPWVGERANLAGLWTAMDRRGTQEVPIEDAISPKQ